LARAIVELQKTYEIPEAIIGVQEAIANVICTSIQDKTIKLCSIYTAIEG